MDKAKKLPQEMEDTIRRHGVPDSMAELFSVPPSHRSALDGAEVACRHIATKGLGPTGVSRVYFSTVEGKHIAMCAECSKATGGQAQEEENV